jgi:ankyrin repeat protein
MPKGLPPRPDLEWLRRAAKERLSELRKAAPAAKLHQAQHDIAQEHGFNSWRVLKAHVDALSLDGQIITAAAKGDAPTLARLLAEHPAKLNITGGSWDRPLLHLAAEGGHLTCVELLLRLGVDVNRRDTSDRATALHWAAQEGHLDVAKCLINAGADINGEGDEHELGVIGWATCFQRVRRDVAELLLAHGARPTVFAAVALDRPDLVRQLAAADPEIVAQRMSRFERGRTPLHLAVQKNRRAIVDLLLELGADPVNKDDIGNAPIKYVKAPTDARIAEALIAAGGDPTAPFENRFHGATPVLNVKSVSAAIGYYVEKLGFEKEWDWGTPPTFGSVRRDEVRLFLSSNNQRLTGATTSISVHDVDALYEEYQRRGAIIRDPPKNYSYGVREMNVDDLDGHRLVFGSDPT